MLLKNELDIRAKKKETEKRIANIKLARENVLERHNQILESIRGVNKNLSEIKAQQKEVQ